MRTHTRSGPVLKAVAAWLGLLLVLVGVPLALLSWVPPRTVLHRDWLRLLTAPDDGSVLLVVLAAACWVTWAMLAISVVTEAGALLSRGRWHPRLPALGWLRPLSTVLVGAALGAWLSSASPAARPPSAPAASAAPARVAAAPATATSQMLTHRVVEGDDLWALAAHYYGDGTQWRRIVEANPGITCNTDLPAGTSLRITGKTVTRVSPLRSTGDSTQDLTVVVADGDTLWSLAERHLGDGNRWPEIVAANTSVITDPDDIHTGWQLRIPGSQTLGPDSDQPASARPPATALVDHPSMPEPDPREAVAGLPNAEVEVDPTRVPSPLPTAGSPSQADSNSSAESPANQLDGPALAALAALGVGATLASLVTTVWRRGRRLQLQQRPLGRRLIHPAAELGTFATAVNLLAAQASPPVDPAPAAVILGALPNTSDDAEAPDLIHDLTSTPLLGVVGDEEPVAGLLGSFATCLVCADWAAGVNVTVVGQHLDWLQAFDHPDLRRADTLAEVLPAWLGRLHRRCEAGTELADDLSPEVMLVATAPTSDEWVALAEVAGNSVGMTAVVMASPETAGACSEVVEVHGEDEARLRGSDLEFRPQLINEAARRAVVELSSAAVSTATLPAPWWASGPPDGISTIHNAPVIRSDREGGEEMLTIDSSAASITGHPFLRILGRIELLDARGEAPTRAARQCAEYCSWLLRNPGRTAATMSQALLVAEGTRRSNVSRLRSWLGWSTDGAHYLPEAYTGRISLDSRVSSDWEQVQLLISRGVNLTPNQALADALAWVRGEPFADAAPTQWHWADEWRSDIISTVRDIALVLAERSVASGDLATARWAIDRGLRACVRDELLLAAQISVESKSGNTAEAERLVHALTRHARNTGTDLLPETVEVIQLVIEGRTRSQWA